MADYFLFARRSAAIRDSSQILGMSLDAPAARGIVAHHEVLFLGILPPVVC
jgi:hypothetical protein